MRHARFRELLLALLFVLSATQALADTLADIRARGGLRVGVLDDAPPYSFRDPTGRRFGLEVDLAADIAATIGVPLQLVPVDVVERIDALLDGRVDLVLAGLGYSAPIARAVALVSPPYYASGTNVIARKSERLANWAGLAGVPVCSIQGAADNQRLTGDFGVELKTYKSADDAYQALISGDCRAFAFADSAIVTQLRGDREARWEDYEMPLQPLGEHPWVMAARPGDPLFDAVLTGIAVRWHRDGTLLSLQDKWKLARTPFIESLRQIYR